MGKIAVSITLTERERSLLEKEANRNQVGVALKRRIRVILYAFQGKSNKEIATLINSSTHFVGKWRNRWHDNYEALQHRSHGFDGTPLRDSETHELLAKTAVAENIVASISPKHYGNLLKKTNWLPTKVRTGFSLT